MTINDEVVKAYREGREACDNREPATANPYGAVNPRGTVLRGWWAKGFVSRLPGDDRVSFDG